LGFNGERVVPLHDYKALGKFFDRIDGVGGFKVAWFPLVNVDLEGILYERLEVDWKVMRITGI
jgi:hypothetical protein